MLKKIIIGLLLFAGTSLMAMSVGELVHIKGIGTMIVENIKNDVKTAS